MYLGDSTVSDTVLVFVLNMIKHEVEAGQTRLKLFKTVSTMYVQIEECLSVSYDHHSAGELRRCNTAYLMRVQGS
jgi:hypothetical protein